MGAGHDGAAYEIARRIAAAGHEARVVDLFDAAPRAAVWLWREVYRFQLRFAPQWYERTYRLYYRPSRSWDRTLRVLRRITGPTLQREARNADADVVVSTYALATLILSELRARGELTSPLVNFLTDFGVHPRTVHPAVDLHLTVHEVSAVDARRLVSAPVIATGPAVSPRVREMLPDRDEARAALDFKANDRVVIVAAGSWGVGSDLARTVRALSVDGGFIVVTLCGRDERLRRRMLTAGHGQALGWTDQLPRYLAAADVLVENAGGLTAMEACAAGVPVVSYRPIPGHGRDNVHAMVRADISTAPVGVVDLVKAVAELANDSPARSRRIEAQRAMFRGDPAEEIIRIGRAHQRS